MDDAPVAGRAPESQGLGLDLRDRRPAPGELPGGVDARVAAADHDDVGRVGQGSVAPRLQLRHRRVPVRTTLVVGVQQLARGVRHAG